MRRLSPGKVLNISLIVVFVLLVLPLYLDKGVSDSLDHARGTGTVGGIDFKAYYIAADMLRTREDFYDVELQTREVLARGLPLNESFYIYPPLLAILFVPLTTLPIQTAAQLWFMINLGLYGLALILLARSLELRLVSGLLALFWILAFLFPPALFTLYKGQVNIVILLLMTVTYWLYRKGLQTVAGVALGIATMIKLVPVVLLAYFLWKRKYALSLAVIGTLVVIGALGLLIVGVGPHQTYIASVLPSLAGPRPNPGNQSLGGFFSLLLIENAYSDQLAHNPALWKVLTVASSSLFILTVVFLCWKKKRGAVAVDLEFALVVATLPLIANIAWVDFFVILLIPYAVLLKYLSQRKGISYLVALASSSVLLVSSPRLLDLFANLGRHETLLRNPLTMGLPLYGLIILWATVALALRQEHKRELEGGTAS